MTTYQYDVVIEVKAPLDQIIDALTNEQTMKKWQPNLSKVEKKSEQVRLLHYDNNTYKMQMKESVLDDGLPNEITLCYEVTGVKNICKNVFITQNEHVQWTMHVRFEFLATPPAPQDAFQASTKTSMLQLKTYIESKSESL